jgi:hypothetical protein
LNLREHTKKVLEETERRKALKEGVLSEITE